MSNKKALINSLIFCFFLSSAASSSSIETNIETNNENFKDSFETLMKSTEAEKKMLAYLDQLQSLFARGEATLMDYDAELDQALVRSSGVSFENSKSYKKMIVIGRISHHLQEKIIYYYLSLSNILNDKKNNPEIRKKAQLILEKVKLKLDSKEALEVIAYADLKEVLKIEAGVTKKSFDSIEEKNLNVLRENRKKIRLMGKVVEPLNDELNQQIEQQSSRLHLMVDRNNKFSVSDLKYYPSTGSNGNVVGLIFPKNVWALTYDDGPNPIHTPEVVKNLKTLGINATFFWLAENVIKYPTIVDLVKASGSSMQNHSWSHAQLTKVGDQQLNKEIVQSTEVEATVYGIKPRFFRCPYGAGTNDLHIRKMIADLDMLHVFWNVDTLDWQDKDPDSIVARAKKQMLSAEHGVILFHDIHPQSVIASRKLVEWSKAIKDEKNKIRWVTIPEIVDELNGVPK